MYMIIHWFNKILLCSIIWSNCLGINNTCMLDISDIFILINGQYLLFFCSESKPYLQEFPAGSLGSLLCCKDCSQNVHERYLFAIDCKFAKSRNRGNMRPISVEKGQNIYVGY